MARRTYLYALGRPAFDRFALDYDRGPQAHLARPAAASIFDVGRRPDEIVWPLDPGRLPGLPEPWVDEVRSAYEAAWDGAPAAGVVAALERAVAGTARVSGRAGAGLLPPPDVADVARTLGAARLQLPAVRAGLGSVLSRASAELRPPPSPFDPSSPLHPEVDAAAAAFRRLNSLDLLRLVLLKRVSGDLRAAAASARAVIERTEALRAEGPPPPSADERAELEAVARAVRGALAAVDGWEGAGGLRRLRALGRFYDGAAGAGHYVVVERA